MRALYLTERDLELVRRGERLLVRRDGRVILDLPVAQLDSVVVVGNVSLTAPALALLLEAEVPVVFLSYGGRYRARVQPAWSRNALLRRRQYEAAVDRRRSLELARRFVLGKIANQRARLQRAARDLPEGLRESHEPPLRAACDRLREAYQAALSADSHDALRGCEGLAARVYFGCVRWLVRRDGFAFEGRVRRPPRDPLNSLLSFAYSLLMAHVDAYVNVVGFDPYIGYLHDIKHGKPALVLDLMEEFRPAFADALVTSAVNLRVIQPDDFVERYGAVELKDDARKRFLAAFDERLRTRFTHPLFGTEVSWRRAIELQVRILAKCLLGEIPEYVPFRLRG